MAEGGTLFLDEIGDVSTALQVKLLRVLQEKEYEPLGATGPRKADVRIVAASNRALAELVARGVFREDLFYRLNVIRIALPPLAERREDVPLLADHFIEKLNAEKGKAITSISPEACAVLMRHDFPGNIRELENAIEHAFVLCRGDEIRPEHLPPELCRKAAGDAPAEQPQPGSLDQAEAAAIRNALSRHGGHRQRTADALGIHPTTLWRKMKRYGIA